MPRVLPGKGHVLVADPRRVQWISKDPAKLAEEHYPEVKHLQQVDGVGPVISVAYVLQSAGASVGAVRGRACIGGELRLQANRAPASAPLVRLLGFPQAATPLFGAQAAHGTADAGGIAQSVLPLPFAAGLQRLPVHAQALVLDGAAPGGVGLSAATFTVLR